MLFFKTASFSKAFIFSFLVAFLPLLLSAQCTLTGEITNKTGEPLVGANIYFPNLGIGTNTDSKGQFALADFPEGSHQVKVSYVGYAAFEQMVDTKTNNCTFSPQLSSQIITTDLLIVSATRADDRVPMTYTNMDRDELAKNNLGQDVPFLLRWTPSVMVTSDAGTGIGYTGIWIRGSDPTRTNVTINGIPLNDSESQGVYWVNLPDLTSSTEDIQVQRGVGASTNGAGAFGATINLNTNKFFAQPYASLDASTGSFGTYKGSLRFGTGLLNNHFTIDGRLSRITSDGYIDRGTADLSSWYLSGAWMDGKSSLRLNAFSGHEITYQAWDGVAPDLLDDPVLRTSNTAGTEKPDEPHENEVDDYEQTHFQLLFNHQFNNNWYLNLAGHYTMGAGFFEQYKADETLGEYGISDLTIGTETISASDLIRRRWLDNDFYGTTYSLHYDNNEFRATIGGGYNIYEGRHFGEVIWARFAGASEINDTYYDNDATKTDFNIFTKFNYALTDKWDTYLDLQYRSIKYDFLGVDNTGEFLDQSADLNFFNPKAGILFKPNNSTKAYASFAVAQREPNRNDFTGSTPDNRPKPEKLYNTEVGVEKNWQKATLQANVYYMYYKDQLVLNGQINDVGDNLRINVDESYRLGLEFSGGINPVAGLNIQANATISQNKVVQFTEFVDQYDAGFNWIGQAALKREEVDLAFSPTFIGSTVLAYDFFHQKEAQTLELSLLSKYVGQRFLDNSADDNNALDAYFFSDLRLEYRLNAKQLKQFRFHVAVQNLWDNLYETNGWSYRYFLDGEEQLDQGYYPQAGRHILTGVSINF